MESAFRQVIEFERKCGHEPSDKRPAIPGVGRVINRFRLLGEEYRELIEAMVVGDLAEIADSLADLVFVALGTAYFYGIDIPAVWNRVCQANLAKVEGIAHRDASGKIAKPPGWVHPDIGAVLDAQPTLAETYGVRTPLESSTIDSEWPPSDQWSF